MVEQCLQKTPARIVIRWRRAGPDSKIFATTALSRPAHDNSSYDAVDTYIQEQMHRLHIPGASLVIVEGNKIVHVRGFGHA